MDDSLFRQGSVVYSITQKQDDYIILAQVMINRIEDDKLRLCSGVMLKSVKINTSCLRVNKINWEPGDDFESIFSMDSLHWTPAEAINKYEKNRE